MIIHSKIARTAVASVAAIGLLSVGFAGNASAAVPTPSNALTVTALGTYAGGGAAAAENVGFDPTTKRAFITNGATKSLDIVDFSTPSAPTLITSVSISAYGSDLTSVAVKNGVVAVAVPVAPTGVNTPSNGVVVLFDTAGNFLGQVTVGVLPDSLTFSRDGKTIVVAGEAEPLCDPNNNNVSAAQDPLGTVSIISIANGPASPTVTTLDFSSFSASTLLSENVRVFFPNSSAAQDLEPEYATISADGTRAWVTLQENNAMAIVDLQNNQILDVVSFGYKDHSLPGNGLDVSDKDNGSNGPAINIANWPLLGMYMPDAISAFTTESGEFLATANEGDSRDWTCFAEESRISALDFTGSSVSASLRTNLTMGRLTSTKSFPTASPITNMYSFGARSFSIWSTSGSLVWDSGDQLEQYITANYPTLHNAQNGDTTTFDTRSDNKGPEPEGLVVGKVGGRSIAFIGLERAGGFMVYDVTTPTAPVFNSYVNPLLAGGQGPGTTDTGPEGLVFVSGCDTSDGVPLVLVANEISGTTTMYQVTGGAADDCSDPAVTGVVATPAFTG